MIRELLYSTLAEDNPSLSLRGAFALPYGARQRCGKVYYKFSVEHKRLILLISTEPCTCVGGAWMRCDGREKRTLLRFFHEKRSLLQQTRDRVANVLAHEVPVKLSIRQPGINEGHKRPSTRPKTGKSHLMIFPK